MGELLAQENCKILKELTHDLNRSVLLISSCFAGLKNNANGGPLRVKLPMEIPWEAVNRRNK
jgi:hypothetical protein